ncbi:ABC transporter ATP-binding protein [Pseudoroseicyclus aestuarii]|uniref:Peptide/nickel transport system ATP-binding protein n=1 Tax=Pseudoroseicyclus aestuarii TaxID=1795041 RepID=A0A318SRK8_9RHOB|nr:ABC transporter ATP-binding protein [Pseudoroseicyclus aestuarii]PYE80595.1 peptide/nickel transport system ATP-binding protein [Pseudoroseicyclus aestuarii]
MIEIDNLRVFYGAGSDRFEAVRGVTLSIRRGETYGLVGESGSGKSSVLNAIAGRHTDWTGHIRINASSVGPARRSRAEKAMLQIVFQDPYGAIHPKHTVGASIAEPLEIHRRPDREKAVERLLERVGLPPQFRYRFPHQISGGQRQRVSIARALALEAPILLLDEPTSALDVSVQSEVLNLLQDLKEERDLTYLMVSHDMAVVAHMCDRIGVMQGGDLIEEASREQLISGNLEQPYSQELREAALGLA